MRRSTLCALLFFAYTAAAVSSDSASDTCKKCFNGVLHELGRTVWNTIETSVRGFLLGFGAAILKDLLKQTSDSVTDFSKTFKFARVAGLGMASFLVGISIVLPARIRYELLHV